MQRQTAEHTVSWWRSKAIVFNVCPVGPKVRTAPVGPKVRTAGDR